MKRIVVMLTCLFLSFSTWAQLPSDCTVPDVLRNNYEFDVAHLAYKWLIETHSPDTSLIEIPQWAKDPIWEGLAAIYHRHDIIEIDSLFNKYCVHNSCPHSTVFQDIFVHVDTSVVWFSNWEQLQIITGVPGIDSLFAKYEFTLKSCYIYPNKPYASVWFTTSQSINVLPICDSLATFIGINKADPGYCIGDGNTIEFEYSGDSRLYTFTLAWGDCPAGCTSFHIWKFMVNPDCAVDFLGIENYISDHFYPVPSNCNLSSNVPGQSTAQPNVTVFPNPAEEFQTIRTDLPGILTYVLVDGWGRKIMSGTFQIETVLDLSAVNKGLYFLVLQKDNTFISTKKIQID